MDMKEVFFQWSINILITNISIKVSGCGIKNENISNKEHKPIIRKFNKIKVQSPFTDNISVADLADMQLIKKFNKKLGSCCVLLIFLFYVLG